MKKSAYYLICCMLLISACEDDENETTSAEIGFVHSLVVGENTFLSGFKDLDVGSANNDNAYIHSKSAFFKVYKDYVFVYEREEDRITKYKKTGNDLVKDGDALLLTAKSKVNSLHVVDDDKAYITLYGSGKVGVINPTNMTLDAEIDLSEYSLGKEMGDINPEPIASISRDGKLFVFLWQEAAEFYPNAGSHAVVIDIATNAPEKMISDTNATMLCSMPAGESFIDENGDIYVYAQAGFGYFPQFTDGFLRIKKGQTEFDSDYYFPIKGVNIEGITNNYADYIFRHVYAGNGMVYGYMNVPGNASSTPDPVNDQTMQPCVINIYNKTIEKLDMPASAGWGTSIAKAGDNTILFGMTSDDGTGYYEYNHITKEYLGKTISTDGSPFCVFEME